MLAALVLCVLVLIVPPASAQSICASKKDFLDALAAKYGEAEIMNGTASDGTTALMVLANPETGTWSIMIVRPGGFICMLASGDDYQTQAYVRPKTHDRGT
jgi:hypothetical protein